MNKLDFLYQEIGKRIYDARKRGVPRLTQKELAEKVGLTRTSIVHIENGNQKLPIDKLYLIAEALKVDVFELLPKSVPTEDPLEKLVAKIDAVSQKRIEKDQYKEIAKEIAPHVKTKEERDND